MSDAAGRPGWWLASDGRWYPPALHPEQGAPSSPAAPPPGAGWWLASDDRWYPPALHPAPPPPPPELGAPDQSPALGAPPSAPLWSDSWTPQAWADTGPTGRVELRGRVRLAAAAGLIVNLAALAALAARLL